MARGFCLRKSSSQASRCRRCRRPPSIPRRTGRSKRAAVGIQRANDRQERTSDSSTAIRSFVESPARCLNALSDSRNFPLRENPEHCQKSGNITRLIREVDSGHETPRPHVRGLIIQNSSNFHYSPESLRGPGLGASDRYRRVSPVTELGLEVR